MTEEWKDVKGFEGFYQISNLGRVRSLDRYVNGTGKKTKQFIKGVILKAQKRKSGHLDVLLKKNGLEKRCWVHRLVASAFLSNINNLPIVNHIDSNPENNVVTNLEWCSQKHNIQHCVASGRFNARKGIEHKDCKLTENQVLEIRRLGEANKSYYSIAKLYGISEAHAKNIIKRVNWKHL
jgi:hypothetical protein